MSSTLQSLLTVTERPFNAETPLSALSAEITPTPLFYVRSNFDIPVLDAALWTLRVDGMVATPHTFTLQDLQALPRHEVVATVECAGNGRKLMQPVPEGTAWDLGAVSTGRFSGVRLRDLLEMQGVDPAAVEIVFEGADQGRVEGDRLIHFVRSLPLERALHDDTLVAWEMNGAPLTPDHGYPVRLFVPGWYGVASVKWLTRITAVERPLDAYFQTEAYVYMGHPAYPPNTPVTLMQVRALATAVPEAPVDAGIPFIVSGIAWSGFAPIARVSTSVDGGASWTDAVLQEALSEYSACGWSAQVTLEERREHELIVRAEDRAGGIQPLEPVWNDLGYGNNVAQRVRITAR
jgi:sulfite oxidase